MRSTNEEDTMLFELRRATVDARSSGIGNAMIGWLAAEATSVCVSYHSHNGDDT